MLVVRTAHSVWIRTAAVSFSVREFTTCLVIKTIRSIGAISVLDFGI